MTSTLAERMFALGRDHDARAGANRDDTRADVILGKADAIAAFMRGRKRGDEKWKKLRKVARQGLKESMHDKRREAGQQLQAERKAKLEQMRGRQARRARC
eukprot:6173513-Pleurochrysis_carterae.AAC.2